MKAVVTGVAGFIGSHLAERLIKEGMEVVGVDAFLPYYSPKQKEANIASLKDQPRFRLIKANLLSIDLETLLSDVDLVFHMAAQPGVRASWGHNFKEYARNNLEATQELLEAARGKGLTKFIHASSSSVYGEVQKLPISETDPLRPVSPYGVTKLAAEKLCQVYAANFSVPVTMLRFFTVFGPRQRPDMAIHRFIVAAIKEEPIEIFGDGSQTRDFTYVADVVEACLLAAQADSGIGPYNIGGGSRVAIKDLVALIEKVLDTQVKIEFLKRQPGDVSHTHSDTQRAREQLGFKPQFDLEEGLFEEAAWLRSQLG